ncbi:MAG TPA: FecR domain-containing protein [Gammaproteobacteria bacterium]
MIGLKTAAIVAIALSASSVEAEIAGEIEFARGAATAQSGNQPARIVAQGQSFNTGEVLSTSSRSFAVIKLQDGSRFTLRPNTQFVVEGITASRNSSANAVLQLFKGGVRAITGFISKFNKDGYQLKTPVATIGIRGTEFDARLCEGDCGNEPSAAAAPATLTSARLAFARGQLSIKSSGGAQRPLQSGATVNEGETLITGRDGVAVLAFPDNSRVTVQPGSQLVIRRYRFNEAEPGAGESVLELVRGGLRAVSGLIGKFAPKSYRVEAPVATIGIRGTGFDLLCKGLCVENGLSYQPLRAPDVLERLFARLLQPAYAQSLPANGMYAYVWSGQIELQLQDKTFPLLENKVAFITNKQQAPVFLPSVPQFMQGNPFPRPDKVDADPDKLFKKDDPKPGLYVGVYDGEVNVGKTVLKPGEASFTGPDRLETLKLNTVPEFLQQDPFPRPAEFDSKLFRLLNVLEDPKKEFECEM